MTVQQIEDAAKAITESDLPFISCYDEKSWKNLRPNSALSFDGVAYIAQFMREKVGTESFAGEPPFLKLECSEETILRFSHELMAGIRIEGITLRGIQCAPVNPLRANVTGTEGPTLIAPDSMDWEYAIYEISLLYGANPVKRPNSIAILSRRLLPFRDLTK